MLRYLLYPFLAYRSVLHPTLLVSLIVVPIWTVLRLWRIRASGQHVSLGRELLLLTLVVYLCGVAAATLDPNDRARMRTPAMPAIELRPKLATLTCSTPKLRVATSARFFCMYNAKGNVLMFFPLGVLIPLLWKRLRFWNVILIAMALSTSIEIIQYMSQAWGSYRLADINDVILNTVGASVGLLVVSVVRSLGRPTSSLARSKAAAG